MKGYVFATTPLPGATRSALIQQAVVIFFSNLILDDGAVAQVCLYAFAGFWVGAGLLVARRGAALTWMDIRLIRWSYIPLCVAAFFLTHWIWRLRGY